MSLVSVIFRTKEERKAGDRLLLRQLERGLPIAAQGRESRSAVRASTAAGSVAQLAQKRTTARSSSSCSQNVKAYFSSSRSRCARVRTGNCWLVRESKWRGRPRRRQASRMRRACSTP